MCDKKMAHYKDFLLALFCLFFVVLEMQARRNFRALRGLVRLQGVVRSPNAQRQTMNAMKQMQLLVRVQTQIQSRRIQMLETQNQAYRNTKDVDGNLSKWALNQLVKFARFLKLMSVFTLANR